MQLVNSAKIISSALFFVALVSFNTEAAPNYVPSSAGPKDATIPTPPAKPMPKPLPDLNYSFTLDARDQAQSFEGWGMSLAWFGNVIFPGNGFVDDWKTWNSIVADYYGPKGLGFTIARYNIGGGESPKFTYLFAANQSYPNPDYMIEGFMTSPGQWNWQADQPQIQLLLKAKELGANIFEAFSNSPPYFWLKSGSVTGAVYKNDGQNGETGAYDNLLDANYNDFANYLAQVVLFFKNNYNVQFRTLEPVNEPRPDTKYWVFKQDFPNGKVQEGCHFSIVHQNTIQKAVANSIQSLGLSTVISGPDETGIDYSLTSLQGYDSNVLKNDIQQINTHSYIEGDRVGLRKFAADHDKRLWMSEFGTNTPGMDGALEFAGNILADLKVLGAQAWIIWQPDWGLIKLGGHNQVTYYKEYFAMKQYTAFIRPGSVFINNSDDQSLSAYDSKAKRLVIVTLNSENRKEKIKLSLTSFNSLPSQAHIFATSDTQDMADLGMTNISGNEISYVAGPRSVTSVVFENVSLK